MTDNRTTDLLRLLEKRGVKCEVIDFFGVKAVVWDGNVCRWVALPDEGGLAVAVYEDYLTPYRAIAATLGSEREAELVKTINDVLRHATDTVWVSEAETLVDRMVSLGIYEHDVYEGARPWEVD